MTLYIVIIHPNVRYSCCKDVADCDIAVIISEARLVFLQSIRHSIRGPQTDSRGFLSDLPRLFAHGGTEVKLI